jgi:hypothetical protein
MKNGILLVLMNFMILSGFFAGKAMAQQAKWNTYSNQKHGYEIKYPEGFDLWPTGPEGKRDGASIRIALKEHQALTPVLDVQINPRTSKEQFLKKIMKPKDMTLEIKSMMINGSEAKQAEFRWEVNKEIAFVHIHLNGVVFRFAAASGLKNFSDSQWWQIISKFRFTGN